MAITEPQFPGWRLSRRRGEALPYINPFTNAQLVAQYAGATNPSLNIAAILPAGTVVQINGQTYVTRNATKAGQQGEIDPLNWHPTYIVPKKATDTFIDRASVYWDGTNNYATSTSSGNTFIGYAILNPRLSLNGTTTSGSTLTGHALPDGTTYDGQTEAYTVTGGTSGDAVYLNYGSGDDWMEVEVVAVGAATLNISGGLGPIQGLAAGANNQAAGTVAGNGYYLVSGANNAAGVVLTSGRAAKMKNSAAATATGLWIYPPVLGQINGLGVNTGLNMGGTYSVEITPAANNSLQFYTFPTTPS